MLRRYGLYKVYCDECGAEGMDYIAADEPENARMPIGWERRVSESGEHQHICPPCAGNPSAESHQH